MNVGSLAGYRQTVFFLLAAMAAASYADEPAPPKATTPNPSTPALKSDRHVVSNAKVTDLIAVLETGKDEERFDAALALAELGPRAADAVAALIKDLRRDPDGPRASFDALVRIGAPAAPALAELLDDGDYKVQSAACDALTKMGPEAALAAPLLIKKLNSDTDGPISSWKTRQTAWCGVVIASTYRSPVDMLAAMKSKAVPLLVKALADGRRSVRGGVAFALGEMGAEAKDAVPALVDVLSRELSRPAPDEDLWSMYVWALGRIGPSAKTAVPLLQRTLVEYRPPKDSSPKGDDEDGISIRFRQADPFTMAAEALPSISPHDLGTLPLMIDRLKRERLPGSAWHLWSDFGGAGAKQLAALAGHDLPKVRRRAAAALYATNLISATDASTALPEMMALLDDKEFRSAAVRRLGDIGPPARAALPKLLTFLAAADCPYDWLNMASEVLRIDPNNRQAIDYFVRELHSGDRDRRKQAVLKLHEHGQNADTTVPALLECLKSPDPEFRCHVATTLGTMKSQAAIIIPALAPLIRDLPTQDPQVYRRHEPVFALADLGPASLPVLIRALDDADVRSDAAEALGLLGPAAAPAVPKLIEFLKEKSPWAVFKTLGSIGPAAKAALPALEERLKDKNSYVREAARAAIRQIRG